MGPEHPAVPVGRGPGQRGAAQDHVEGVEERSLAVHRRWHPVSPGGLRHRRGEGGASGPPPRLRVTLQGETRYHSSMLKNAPYTVELYALMGPLSRSTRHSVRTGTT